jgi:uncharacterized protein (DUF1778 family)
MVTPEAKAVQALTLRLPVDDYNVLRAEAFVRDLSINEVVISAIREAIPEPRRRELLHLLEQARATQSERGRATNIPRNPLRRGARKRSKA